MGEQVAAVESKEEWVIRAPTVVAAAVEAVAEIGLSGIPAEWVERGTQAESAV